MAQTGAIALLRRRALGQFSRVEPLVTTVSRAFDLRAGSPWYRVRSSAGPPLVTRPDTRKRAEPRPGMDASRPPHGPDRSVPAKEAFPAGGGLEAELLEDERAHRAAEPLDPLGRAADVMCPKRGRAAHGEGGPVDHVA